MIKKTKQYDMFKFRDDNRDNIDSSHVNKIARSIELNNLLHMRPILVNSNMEIIDGQNRLKAAEKLGVEVYYEVQEALKAEDIILLNTAKAWGNADYLNFYCKNGYSDYIKFKEFMDKHGLNIRVSLYLCTNNSNDKASFRDGKLKFDSVEIEDQLDVCKETISIIKNTHGFCSWCDSAKFWKSLIILIRHPGFKANSWLGNVRRLVDQFHNCTNWKEYLKLFNRVYNYHKREKISLYDEIELS